MAGGSRRVVFAACAKNCAGALGNVLGNIARIAALYSGSAAIFLENDSTDNTAGILRSWCAEMPDTRVLTFGGLDACCPIRTLRLAALRNQYLSVLRSQYADYDHVVVIDCDEVNNGTIDLDSVGRAIAFLEADDSRSGVFPAQNGLYYDLWALRHPQLCPGDVWEEAFDDIVSRRVSVAGYFRETVAKRMLVMTADEPPLEVESAFGGMAIYRIRDVLKSGARYRGYKRKSVAAPGAVGLSGWQTCEHVAFNAALHRSGGKLFVLPFLVNHTGLDSRWFGPNPRNNPDYRFDLKWLPFPEAAIPPGNRNAPCPCGSGQRYKSCHGDLTLPVIPDHLRGLLAEL